MKIAILLSTYNGERYLNKQLESIAAQTLKKDLIIYVRDDGSKDSTLEIINSWKGKINITVINGKNCGPAKSFWELLMNKSISADYYAFCDQDDIWDSNKLERAVDYLKSNPSCSLYSCNCRLIDANDKVIAQSMTTEIPEISYERLFICGITQGCSMVFTDTLREFILKCNIKCIPMHDIITMLYAKALGDIYWDKEPCFSYRLHNSNVVAKSNKNIFSKMRTSIWNWINSSKNSMSIVAEEILKNITCLDPQEESYLNKVKNYKHSIRCRLSLCLSSKPITAPHEAKRSYIIRLIFKLL